MPATKLGGVPNWKSVKVFMEKYDLKKTKAYELIKESDFQALKTGKRGIKVNINATDDWFARNYN